MSGKSGWLKSPQMELKHVKRSKKKHRYIIMYLIKKVGKRSKGMGLNIIKFHSIVHMTDDILNFGVAILDQISQATKAPRKQPN